MTFGRVARATSLSHASSTSSATERLFDATSAATRPSRMFDPVSLVATGPPQPVAIMAVVVVFPLVPLTSTTSRPRARFSRRSGAIVRPTRPPMTVPEPREATRERILTARTATFATSSRKLVSRGIEPTLTTQKTQKDQPGGWLVLLQSILTTQGGFE